MIELGAFSFDEALEATKDCLVQKVIRDHYEKLEKIYN